MEMSMKRLIWIMLFVMPMAYGADIIKGAVCADNGDLKCALAELTPSANKGGVVAQFALGVAYENNQNYIKAIEWYRKATDQGDASSQLRLGNMYYNGKGVKQDYFEAVKWGYLHFPRKT